MCETILLVDDEAQLRMLASVLLQANGYQVLEASSGEEALRVSEGVSVDMILTDVEMPNMSGRQLVERLKVSHPEMGVLYMTGFGGGDEVLEKPFTPAELVDRVRRLCMAKKCA